MSEKISEWAEKWAEKWAIERKNIERLSALVEFFWKLIDWAEKVWASTSLLQSNYAIAIYNDPLGISYTSWPPWSEHTFLGQVYFPPPIACWIKKLGR